MYTLSRKLSNVKLYEIKRNCYDREWVTVWSATLDRNPFISDVKDTVAKSFSLFCTQMFLQCFTTAGRWREGIPRKTSLISNDPKVCLCQNYGGPRITSSNLWENRPAKQEPNVAVGPDSFTHVKTCQSSTVNMHAAAFDHSSATTTCTKSKLLAVHSNSERSAKNDPPRHLIVAQK